MSVSGDGQYQALAARAASRLGSSSPAIIRAILAQWQCELGNDPYPPARNNPGNVAAGFAGGTGIPYTVPDLATNPQPSNPIVTFASPEAGADCYAIGLARFSSYSGVRSAVAAGDGLAFIQAMGGSGYGTGTACMLSVYGLNTVIAPTSTSSSGYQLAAAPTTNLTVPFGSALTGSPFHMPASALFVDPTVGAFIDWASQFIPPDKLPDPAGDYGTEMRAILAPYIGKAVGSLPAQLPISLSAAATQSSNPLDGINFAWVPGVAVNLVLLVVIVGLAYGGLRQLLSS